MRLTGMKIRKDVMSGKNDKNDYGASTKYLEMIAIENSANCNLKCEACPTVYAKNYPKKFMGMETFKRIFENLTSDIVPKCGLIGWGEPFLDPRYFEKLRYLKKINFFVGSTSNFTLFTEEVANNIIDSGLDHLNISMDTNHFNASGMTLNKMIEKINMLFKLRDIRSSSLVVGVVIVAFKSSFNLICNILQMLKNYPFTYIDIIPLLMIPYKDLYAESMSKQEFIFFKEKILDEFKDLSISFDFALLEDKILANCRADIFKTAYINYKGEFCPCSMLAMEFPNLTFSGELEWTQPLSFGRLDQSGFKEIWESENYLFFRNQFRQNKLPEQCICCNHWRKLL